MVKSAEQVMAEIQAAIGQRPKINLQQPDYSSILNRPRGIDLGAPTDFSKYDVSGHGTGKKKKKESGLKPDFWGMVSGTLGQVGGVVTDSAYHTFEDLKDLNNPNKGIPEKLWELLVEDSIGGSIVRGAKNGGKKQWDNWKDGEFSWGDVPGIGFLNGADKGYKRGHDIIEDHTDMKDGWKKTAAGIGIDIALDPLTYLTGGAATATKLSKVAEMKKMAEITKAYGLSKVFKNTDELADELIPVLQKQYEKYPNLMDKMVDKKFNEIIESIKTARNTTYNANINKLGMSVPFSNKLTAPIANIKQGNLLHRSEATVGNSLVQDVLTKATNDNPALKGVLQQAIQKRYGVNALDELTKTQFDDLANHLEPVIGKMKGTKSLPDVKTTQSVVENVLPEKDFTRLMDEFSKHNIPWKDVQKQLDEILDQVKHDPKLRASYGSQMAKMVENYWATKPAKNFSGAANARKAESMNGVSKFLSESDNYKSVATKVDEVHPTGSPEAIAGKNAHEVKNVAKQLEKTTYNEMNNAKTGFEHWLNKKNPFDARTLKTGDKFLDSMADHISDANSRRVGETAMYTKGMEAVQKTVNKVSKGMTPEQKSTMMKNAIYHLEGKAPDSYPKGWKPTDGERKIADIMKPLLRSIGQDDMEAGTLSRMADNYFPHVANKGTKDIDDMIEFDKRHTGLGDLSSDNKFDKTRKSFKTIADQDNYVAKLAKAISKETDEAVKENLQRQLERVEDFFDTDVVKVLTRRIGEGVRSRAVKELQGKLSRFGMMKSVKAGEDTPTGMKKLDPDEAKKLGLPKGQTHYMNEKVFEGLKKTDEIFTDEGMEMWKRHLSAISDIWRPLVTYYKPAHYVNNWIGNSFQNLAAGVNISDYKNAGKVYTKYKLGKALTKSEEKLIKSAYKHNVISGGFLFDAKGSYEFAKSTNLEKAAKVVGDNKVVKKLRLGGEMADDLSRLANFVNGVKKYGSAEKAAQQTREYLFNYNELTKADKAMRTVVPFWNWTKRNIPLQVKLLMEQPKYAMNTERLRDFFNDGEKGEDWQKETGIHIPKSITDALGTNERYMGIPSPTNDLTLMNNPASFLGSTNPALKMTGEMAMNKKFFTGSPISYGSDDVMPEDIMPYLISNLGVGNDMYKAGTGETSIAEFLANLFKSTTEVRENGGN